MKALKIIAIVLIGIVILGFAMTRMMGINAISFGMHDTIFQKEGIALGGYDPVSYFSTSGPHEGNPHFEITWKESMWRFASEENMKLFKESPEQYAPAFGGYCAFAVSKGFTAPSSPEFWELHQGQLYLFSNQKVKQDFAKDFDKMKALAEKNWK